MYDLLFVARWVQHPIDREGLITQGALVQIQPPQPHRPPRFQDLGGFDFLAGRCAAVTTGFLADLPGFPGRAASLSAGRPPMSFVLGML